MSLVMVPFMSDPVIPCMSKRSCKAYLSFGQPVGPRYGPRLYVLAMSLKLFMLLLSEERESMFAAFRT